MVTSDPESKSNKCVTFCVSEPETEDFRTFSDIEGTQSEPESRCSPQRINERGAYGNKSSPNRIPSTKRRRITRDTLNGRLRKRKGKPGSRKYHRWQNEKVLGRREDELSDTGPLEDEMEQYLFDPKNQNIFYQAFEDDKLRSCLQPFLDITEEEERLLRGLDFSDDSESDEDYQNTFRSRSHIAYQRLTTDGRKSINKYADTDFLSDLDNAIFGFIQENNFHCRNSEYFVSHICQHTGRLFLTMKDSHHRLMAHSVCSFYNAISVSELNDVGVKVIKISAPSNLQFTPMQRLVDYLRNGDLDRTYWRTNTNSVKNRCGVAARKVTLSEFSNETNLFWV